MCNLPSPTAPPAERGLSLESIYRGSLTVDLCECNKIISLKNLFHHNQLGATQREKNPGPLGTCPLVKTALLLPEKGRAFAQHPDSVSGPVGATDPQFVGGVKTTHHRTALPTRHRRFHVLHTYIGLYTRTAAEPKNVPGGTDVLGK